MIIIIRALPPKKKIKKKKGQKKAKEKKKKKKGKKRPKKENKKKIKIKRGQCYYPFPHLCFKVAPCSLYRESHMLSLLFTSGNFSL